MEPITWSLVLTSIFGGIIGNRADAAFMRAWGAGTEALASHITDGDFSINNELEQAVQRSYLRAQISIASDGIEQLTGNLKYRGVYQCNPQDRSDVTWLENFIKDSKKQISQLEKNAQHDTSKSSIEDLKLLVTPEGLLNKSLIQEVDKKILNVVIGNATIPQVYRQIAETSFFARICLFFSYEVRSNPEVRNIFQTQLLAAANQKLNDQSITLSNIEQSLQETASAIPNLLNKLNFLEIALKQLGSDAERRFSEIEIVLASNAKTLEEISSLLSEYQKKASDIGKIKQENDFVLSNTRIDIGGFHIERSTIINEAIEGLSKAKLLEVSGAPGIGKSATLKLISEYFAGQGLPIIFLSGDRILGTGWSGYANQLQITQNLEDLLLTVSDGSQSLLFIDGIDRVGEENRAVINDLFCGVSELAGERMESSLWKIIYSVREENIQDLYQWLNWQSLGQPQRLKIPELTIKELRRVAEHSPRLRPLLNLEHLSSILRTPLILSLLEDIRMLPASTTFSELPPLSTEIEISRIWWDRLIGDGGSIAGRDRKNSLLRVGRQVAKSPGGLFLAEDNLSPEALISLKSDRILIQEPEREVFRFAHNVFEDWIIYRVLDQQREQLSNFILELGEPLGLFRSVQLLGSALLENISNAEAWMKVVLDIENNSILSSKWRYALLTAPLYSPRANELLEKAKPILMENNASRLIEIMIALRTTAVIPNFSLMPLSMETRQKYEEQLMPLFMHDPTPIWSIWHSFINWLLNQIDELPVEVRYEASKLMEIWQTKTKEGADFRKQIGEIVKVWLEEEEVAK